MIGKRSMYKRSSYKSLICAIAIVVVCCMSSRFVFAQSSITPIYSINDAIENMSWALDSQSLVFQVPGYAPSDSDPSGIDDGVKTRSKTWFQYNVQSELITTSNVWPLQPTGRPVNNLDVATDRNGQASFIFPSPNGRYVVYAAPKSSDSQFCEPFATVPEICPWQLALADLQTSDHIILKNNMITETLREFPSHYFVRWSGNSAAFTVQTMTMIGGGSVLHYISNFQPSLANFQVKVLSDEGILISGQQYFVDRVLALSRDGQQAILGGGTTISLWDVQHPEKNKYIATDTTWIMTAMFSPRQADKIWYIGTAGLIEYDINGGNSMLLNAIITSTLTGDGEFSPDGNHVAMLKHGQPGPYKVYMALVGAPTANLTTTDITNDTLTATYTPTDTPMRTSTGTDTPISTNTQLLQMIAHFENQLERNHRFKITST